MTDAIAIDGREIERLLTAWVREGRIPAGPMIDFLNLKILEIGLGECFGAALCVPENAQGVITWQQQNTAVLVNYRLEPPHDRLEVCIYPRISNITEGLKALCDSTFYLVRRKAVQAAIDVKQMSDNSVAMTFINFQVGSTYTVDWTFFAEWPEQWPLEK